MSAIFFLSDYGTADEFVGVVHAVLHRLAPTVPVIDLSHQVAPFDIVGAGALLARAVPHLGPGVVLAVVDPAVGTARRALAVRVAGAGPEWLVGPDNGLLAPAVEALGGARRAVSLIRPGPGGTGASGTGGAASTTFDGRDLFGPVAAHLATGGDPMTLGADVDPGSLVPSPVGATAAAGRSGGEPALVTTAVWIDRFGNVQLNAGPGDLGRLAPGPGATVRVTVGDASTGRTVPARQVVAFAELEPDEVGVIVDSAGRLAVVLDRASAAERLGVPGPGVVITLTGPPVSGRPR